ncbi:hypothetical protein GGR56DRAFT_36262 [Xylariaceae sp. FL0804]|nr:hypothetical protein GGR56DRAFT_36262 [Xylariaceae sp. FL0804]
MASARARAFLRWLDSSDSEHFHFDPVPAVLPHSPHHPSAMNRFQSLIRLIDWQIMQDRGRRRVARARLDPVFRARLEAEALTADPVAFPLSKVDQLEALRSLPAYCMPSKKPLPVPASTGFSFLKSFPPEIRVLIYQYAVDYPDCRDLYDSYYRQKASESSEERRRRRANSVPFRVRLQTPTILLLCKKITREALDVLRLRPLVIDRIPPWIMGASFPLALTDFISERTLQSIRFVEIKPSFGDNPSHPTGMIWLVLIQNLLDAWSKMNSVVRLRVMVKASNVFKMVLWDVELRAYEQLHGMIDQFVFKHGSRPNIVDYEHWVLDGSFAYRTGFRNPLIRRHPDPKIWQGSILEWV